MTWGDFFKAEKEKEYFKILMEKLSYEYKYFEVFPEQRNLYKAFELTPFDDIKVVILGQDPYKNWGEANGLAFSVNKGMKIPASLRNIYRELEQDLKISKANHGDLTPWAKQGVLLMNTVLTLRAGESNSHKGLGWIELTNNVIKAIDKKEEPVIFMLWGKQAQEKASLIKGRQHKILTAPHPVAYYDAFIGNGNFSKVNKILTMMGKETINWQLD